MYLPPLRLRGFDPSFASTYTANRRPGGGPRRPGGLRTPWPLRYGIAHAGSSDGSRRRLSRERPAPI